MSAMQHGDSNRSSFLSAEEDRRIIEDGDAALLTAKAEVIGGQLARDLGLTTAQIRNVFGTARQIEMNWGPRATEQQCRNAARQLILLKPKLVYQARRERGRGGAVQELAKTLIPAINLVGQDRERFQHFMDFFEAILAYHTAASN